MKILAGENVITKACHHLGSMQIQVTTSDSDKSFIITETVNGFRIRIGDGEYREIEIRPQSKEEIYISLR